MESYAYPGAAQILQQQLVTLKSGDGNIQIVDCTSTGNLIEVFSRILDPGPVKVCFRVTGPTGYLALELPKVYNIKGDDHTVKATLKTDGSVSSFDVRKNYYTPVGEGSSTDGTTLLELTAADGPAATGTANAFPAVASVNVGQPGRAGSRACTGTLVDRYWVLTAASCFAADPAAGFSVPAGPPALATTATIGRADLATSGGQTVAITELVPRSDRDLVMARLATPVTDITPLPLATTAPVQGETLRVAGYGRTQSEWVPNKLHTPTFNVDAVKPTGVDITGLSPAGASICQGDTGAPTIRETGGTATLAAVAGTSWQHGCLGSTETRNGATSTRIDDLAGWVQDVRYRTVEVKPGTHLFAIGSEGSTYGLDVDYTAGTWGTSWTRLDGTSLKAITSVTTGPGSTVRLYAVGTDGHVYSRDGVTGGYWGAWMEIPGGLTGAKAITASVTGGTKVHVQVIGADGMYNQDADYAAGTWSVWTKMDSTHLKAITSAVTGNTTHIYAVNEDSKVYTRDANYDVGWGNWVEVPGGLTGTKAITASVTGGSSVHVQVIGADGMYNQDANYAGNGWTTWTKMDSTNLKAIASTATGNTAHIYAVNENTQLYTRDANYSVGWGTWADVPGGAAGLKGITATTSG
ncbi:trypsin-like serine protease [Kitasatospora herbaricolor]|uniref:trypsin-like serine protease n=1 Tax=Kitasatospora herbaricolor TaxID=68217 RepID=UPI0036DB1354